MSFERWWAGLTVDTRLRLIWSALEEDDLDVDLRRLRRSAALAGASSYNPDSSSTSSWWKAMPSFGVES